MSDERVVRHVPGEPDRTDHERLKALSDEQIAEAVAGDPDAAPMLDADWFASAYIVLPSAKEAISIRLDQDVLDFFRGQGSGYQSRINAVLKGYVEHQSRPRRAAESPSKSYNSESKADTMPKGGRTTKSTRNSGKPWKPAEVKQLEQLAKENTPTRVAGLKLGRTPAAVQKKASGKGITLKPTNQSPYNRRKK